MPGLAATMNAPGSLPALHRALESRGGDVAICQLADGDTRLELGMRAAIPVIGRVLDQAGRLVAAAAVDGIASFTALDAGYAEHGPAGLLAGDEPYAVILADAEAGALVLARNRDGPGLYYARHGQGWLVASEPGALLAAGVSAQPSVEAVRRFIRTGQCDHGQTTFFAQIGRVPADQAVQLAADGSVQSVPGHRAAAPPATVADCLAAVGRDGGRLGVLMHPDRPGLAVLASTLATADRLRLLPVHTVTWAAPGSSPAVPTPLDLMPRGRIRAVAHAIDPLGLALADFVREMGEPVADLGLYLLWVLAREQSGGLDVLVDASTGSTCGLSRLADRIASRYGVTVRAPLRGVDPAALCDEVDQVLADRPGLPLPTDMVRAAAERPVVGPTDPAAVRRILLDRLDRVAAALATPRPWSVPAVHLAALRDLAAGKPVDVEAVFRSYLVELWLATLADHLDADDDGAGEPLTEVVDGIRHLPDATVAGTHWSRMAIRTPVIGPGEPWPKSVAWPIVHALTDEPGAHEPEGGVPAPWFALVSAKVVAVSQSRIQPVWEVKPTRTARVLARLARNRLPRLSHELTMQVALDSVGATRLAVGVAAAALWPGRRPDRFLPDEAALIAPTRPDAVAPADAAVVRMASDADTAAQELLAALRHLLPAELGQNLIGCAVVSADERGCRVIGHAAGERPVPRPAEVIAALAADNPFGQGRAQTPVVLASLVG